MVPAETVSSPAIMRSVVVLPQPDGPSMVKNSVSRTSKLTSSTAARSPAAVVNRLVRLRTMSSRLGTGDPRPGDVAPSLGREQLVELLEVRRAVARRGERIVGKGFDVFGGGKSRRRRRVGTRGAPLVEVDENGVGRLGADVVEEFFRVVGIWSALDERVAVIDQRRAVARIDRFDRVAFVLHDEDVELAREPDRELALGDV